MVEKEPAHFRGLPNWAKIAIIFTAMALGGISVGIGLKDALEANRHLAFSQNDFVVIEAIAKLGHTGTSADQNIVVHALNVVAHLKAITNNQSLATLAIAGGSAFLAVGFCLFLLGADGAFRIQYEGHADGKLAFYATAPGLLCMFLGAVLIGLGATRKHDLRIGDFPISDVSQLTVDHAQTELENSLLPFQEPKAKSAAEKEGAGDRQRADKKSSAADEILLTEQFCIDRPWQIPVAVAKNSDLPGPRVLPRNSVIGGGEHIALKISYRWPGGTKVRVRFLDGDLKLQEKVRKYAEDLNQFSGVKLNFGADAEAEIRVSFADSVSWSYLGTTALKIPKDKPTMNLGRLGPNSSDAEVRSIVLHEFGHVLGLVHEFQPPDHGIEWNHEFVDKFFAKSINQWSPEETKSYFVKKYGTVQTNGLTVDEKSIMRLAIPREFTVNGFHSTLNRNLSQRDKKLLGTIYPRQTN